MNNDQKTCNLRRIELSLEQKLSDEEQTAFELHLADCNYCRRQLEAAAATDDIWYSVRDSLRDRQDDCLQSGDPVLDLALDSATGVDTPFSHDTILKLLAPTDNDRMLGRLGTYEVAGLVGSGGMGVVLKAFDVALNRYVAIKVLAPHLGSSGLARKRFSREAQAAAAVVHDNVMEIHGVADTGGLPYLVMPYVKGPSLQRRLDDEGPLALVEILRIAVQAASGLAAAHAQGLVHRDVKPANILLEDGVERVKLTDFGLARAADDASLTKTGVIAGTPQYMSPEQSRGESVDQKSDLFSLGSVLYAMCTGREPFRAETSYGVLRRITDEQPRSIREINPDIPEWLCQIIGKLMSKKPDDRYESAREVAQLLEQCLAHVQQPTVVPLPDSLKTQTSRSRFLPRTPRSIRTISIIALFGFSLLGITLWQASAPPDIAGKWTGEEWDLVTLETKQTGWYEGSYTDPDNGISGKVRLKWSRFQQRFNGTWQEDADRFGELSLRLVDKEIRGARTIDPSSKVDATTPRLTDFTWTRTRAIPSSDSMIEVDTGNRFLATQIEARLREAVEKNLHGNADKEGRAEFVIFKSLTVKVSPDLHKATVNLTGLQPMETWPGGGMTRGVFQGGFDVNYAGGGTWELTGTGGLTGRKFTVQTVDLMGITNSAQPMDIQQVAIESVVRKVYLPDADRRDVPTVLDLATGQLLDVPTGGDPEIFDHFKKLGKGDLAWDGALITLRGAKVNEWKNGTWPLVIPDRAIMDCGTYRFDLPKHVLVTTAEGHKYLIGVSLGADGGVVVSYHRNDVAAPPKSFDDQNDIQSNASNANPKGWQKSPMERTVDAFLESCALKGIVDNKQLFDELGMADFIAQYGNGESAMREHHDKLPPVMRYAINRATGDPKPEFINYLQSIPSTPGSTLLLRMFVPLNVEDLVISKTVDSMPARLPDADPQSINKPTFRSILEDNMNTASGGIVLDLDSGEQILMTDLKSLPREKTAAIDLSWDNDGGGALMCNPTGKTRFLPLPHTEDFAEATAEAVRRWELVKRSKIHGMLASVGSFCAVSTDQGRLAVIKIIKSNSKQATIDWLLADVTEEPDGSITIEPRKHFVAPEQFNTSKAAPTANAKETPAGRLDLRVAATRGDDGETTLDNKTVEKYIEDLKTYGPETGRRRGDLFAWFPMIDKPRPQLITADYEGHNFVLLANTTQHTLLRESTPPWSVGNVFVDQEPLGHPAISVEMDEAGGRQLGELTKAHLNLPLAILVDDRVISAPTIRTMITTRFQISGSFDLEEAGRLARTMMLGITSSQPVDNAFTDQIERVVNDDKTGSDWMIDLDTGKLYTPPTELDPEKNPKADTKKLVEWARQQGIDATGIKAQGGELQFIESILTVMEKASWESVTQKQVLDALAGVVSPSNKALVGDTLYAFRTREGGTGVLQVVGRGEDSPSVIIRYKLLPSIDSDTNAEVPTLKAVINDCDEKQGREAIDLDRAQQFNLPEAIGWSRQQRDDWLANKNIDLFAEYEDNLWTLITAGEMTLKPIKNDRWDTITASDLEKALSEEVPSTNVEITVRQQRGWRFHTLKFGVTPPVTFAFKTAEGSLGVLRIVSVSEKSKRMTMLFKLLKPLDGTSPPAAVRGPDMTVDAPSDWKVVQRFEVPADQRAAIGKRLGGQIQELSNDVYMAHDMRVQVNVMKCATAEDAAKVHASVLKMKSDPAYCLLINKTVVEFVGQFNVDFAKRAARELLGVSPHLSDSLQPTELLSVEQRNLAHAQLLLARKKLLQSAIEMYQLEYGKYPALCDGWAELTQPDGDKGPIIMNEPKNPFTTGSTVATDDSGDWQYDQKTHNFRAVVPFGKEKAESLGLTSEDVITKDEDDSHQQNMPNQ